MRSLHGLLSFFRCFVRNFGVKCRRILEMMKDIEIVWGENYGKVLELTIKYIVDCGLRCLYIVRIL